MCYLFIFLNQFDPIYELIRDENGTPVDEI